MYLCKDTLALQLLVSSWKELEEPLGFLRCEWDIKTLLHWLRNLKTSVGKAAFCLKESCQGSCWCDGGCAWLGLEQTWRILSRLGSAIS